MNSEGGNIKIIVAGPKTTYSPDSLAHTKASHGPQQHRLVTSFLSFLKHWQLPCNRGPSKLPGGKGIFGYNYSRCAESEPRVHDLYTANGKMTHREKRTHLIRLIPMLLVVWRGACLSLGRMQTGGNERVNEAQS